ncbi:hypothetical protein OAU50_03505 [Planctomycetota bacterium]|nr:hypothetical protein [Planctomycetota bacterium]
MALIVLELLLAIGAIYGGGSLLFDPTGEALGLPQSILIGTPFDDFFIPAILLTGGVGLFPLVLAVLTLSRKQPSWIWHSLVGGFLMVFEVVELAMIGFHILQLIYLMVGLAIFVLGLKVKGADTGEA